MTSVVISQPMLFPWPGFYEQMALADTYLWLDDVQFSKGSFTNRIRILYKGGPKWLSIPISTQHSSRLIRDLSAASEFREGHRAFLAQAFAKLPFAKEALEIVDEVFAHQNLCDLIIASAEVPARWLGIRPTHSFARTAELHCDAQGSDRVLRLCRQIGATRYISGHGGANYLDHSAFERNGISVEYMAYSLTPWPQMASSFFPYASIIDLIATVGSDAKTYLRPATLPWRDFVHQKKGSLGSENSQGAE